MKRLTIIMSIALLWSACTSSEERLKERAAELCRYIPDHELLESSKPYMTADFYAVLDTMFNRLPEHEAMDHEWLYYCVTANGGTIADYEVAKVEKSDENHTIATILVRQQWPDGSFDEDTDVEEHRLYMERVNGEWLMSDFDGHKADCIRHIAISRHEQEIRDVICNYLIGEIAPHYLQGELCIPTLLIVAEEECETEHMFVYGDFWVYWYNVSGDTLKTVSGGNHAGRMTISEAGDSLYVAGFGQTEDGAGNEASAKQIFGNHYEVYETMHSNKAVQEAVRQEQLRELIQRYNWHFRYYQDYEWPAVALK